MRTAIFVLVSLNNLTKQITEKSHQSEYDFTSNLECISSHPEKYVKSFSPASSLINDESSAKSFVQKRNTKNKQRKVLRFVRISNK